MRYPNRELRLLRSLESGDLGTVFGAIDVEHANVPRVVIVLHPDLTDHEGVAAGIQRRIEAARGVEHPGHVPAEGVFEVAGRLSVIMQKVEGKSLERVAKRAPITGPVAARIMAQVVDVLIAASKKGIMHGHLGPNRIMVCNDGQVRLLGLGMAEGTLTNDEDPLYKEERAVHRYAPPERLSGKVNSAVDVYSLGAMLTWALSGRWPRRASKLEAGQSMVLEEIERIVSGLGASRPMVKTIKDSMGFRADLRPYLKQIKEVLQAEAIDDAGWKSFVQARVLSVTENSEVDEVVSKPVPAPKPEPVPAPEPAPEPEPEPESESEPEPKTKPKAAARRKPEVVQVPKTLGRLPPPSTDEMAEPLRVDLPGSRDTDTGVISTEIGQIPALSTDEFNREMTEVVPRELVEELDKNADRWDRMLSLDSKPETKIDKDWVRAARGQSEYRRFGIWAVAVIVVGLVVGWQADVRIQNDFNVPFFAPTEPEPDVMSSGDAPEGTPKTAPVDVDEPATTVPAASPEATPAASPEAEVVPPVKPKVKAAPSPRKAKPATRKSKPKTKRSAPTPTKAKQPAPAPAKTPPPPPQESTEAAPSAEPPAAAAPAKAQKAGPSTAGIRVTGDAYQVQLVAEGRRISGGRVAPGRYNIEVRFRPGDTPQAQGGLTIAAGETALINCKAAFHRCTVRGPWK